MHHAFRIVFICFLTASFAASDEAPWWMTPPGGGASALSGSSIVIIPSEVYSYYGQFVQDIAMDIEWFHAPFSFTAGGSSSSAGGNNPFSVMSVPDPVQSYEFDSDTLEEEGLTLTDGNGTAVLNDFPLSLETPSDISNGRGLILSCGGGQHVRLITQPAVTSVDGPYNINLIVRSNGASGVLSIAVVDGDFDETATLNYNVTLTETIQDAFTRLTIYHEPIVNENTGEALPQTIVIRSTAYPTVSAPISVYIDNLDIIPVYDTQTNNPMLPKTSVY